MTDKNDTITLTRTYEFRISDSESMHICWDDTWQYMWSALHGLDRGDKPHICNEAEELKLAQAAADYWAAHK